MQDEIFGNLNRFFFVFFCVNVYLKIYWAMYFKVKQMDGEKNVFFSKNKVSF